MAKNQHTLSGNTSSSSVHKRQNTLKWFLPFLASFLPIVLISVYSYRIASGSVKELLRTEHVSATGNLSQLIAEDLKEGMNLVGAISSVPGTVDAMRRRDSLAMRSRLKAVTVAYPEVDRAYVTYPDGLLWEEHPQASVSLKGLDLSRSDWYAHVSKNWKPYISGIYRRSTRDKPAITIASPITDTDGSVIGILVFEYPTTQIVQWLRNISLSHEGYLMVVDQNGTLVAHPDSKPSDPLYKSFGDVEPVQQALHGQFTMGEYTDPLYQIKMVATFQPIAVGKSLWVVIAQQPVDAAYAELRHVTFNIGLVGSVMTILTLIMVIVVARIDAKNISLNTQLQEKNIQLKELASIVSHSSDAIVGLTLEGIVTNWNKSAEAMYGYSEKEMVGQSAAILEPAEHQGQLRGCLKKIKSGEHIDEFETTRVKKDGTTFPISCALSYVDDGDQTAVAASSIDRNITQQKEIEQMKSDFISFVSHQLKAPVTAMRWMIESILDGDYGDVSPELTDAMHEMQSVNASNYHLIIDILNVSRIDRGVIEVGLIPTPLQEIANLAARDYFVAAEKAGLVLSVDTPSEEILVLSDKEKMAEAVSNAISNALKHTKQGGITLHLKKEAGYGVIEVEDTGEGMPPEIVQKLFTRDKILGGNTNAEKSSGLGLYIARKFTELQGGEISVRSTLGKGSTFIYRLPLASGDKLANNS
ncbi:hypothetical protein COU76_03725 [Candidatus Peregrinibacteria bacterium CG10_big_fil_rev_8_21_14_0_10_49_10]|nr:MAG: hypothetical protein COU76_03725 [Candidatus Peregrinibacteria bacterium CG10_big_fil_rev_8_21_14_0_10_49_10]